MEFTCKDFKVGKCEREKLVHGETMPLVLQLPTDGKNDMESLLEALGRNKEWFEEMIIKNSAVLLRGFDVTSAEEFNDIVEIKEFPKKVILFCEVPPPAGGETPFVPSFRVTERMLEEFPEFVEELDKKGLRYTFTALSNDDKSSMRGRGWQDAFGTSDPAEAERRAKALGMDVEWLPNGGVKTILGPRSLTRVFDGRKGRRMWFNTLVGMQGKELSSATMADGSEIPEKIVRRCEEIIEEESIQFKWEKGDVLFLDNYALLHGRRPSLPPRRGLVATCK
ncbi:Clavaminate synthase-like protein [Sesamum alatum]|uniref:Clavaminate synthase-like protein n=1 Tax=Sesamum alatum TaxID=300844 RepID=A0AAE1YHL1_9LAMI|nr:Clavaminate synthase-like protein [Sesamum alatum]